jgi:acetate kinase
VDNLILVANPGRSTRRYSVFKDGIRIVGLTFEVVDGRIVCTIRRQNDIKQAIIHIDSLGQSVDQIFDIFDFYEIDIVRSDITKVAVKVIADSTYFNVHRSLTSEALAKLEDQINGGFLKEIHLLAEKLPHAKLVGISDSAYHTTIPEYISNYGYYNQEEAPAYYGIAVGSVVNQLRAKKLLPERLVICHLGYGANFTALKRGKSLNTSFGYWNNKDTGTNSDDLRILLAERRQGKQSATTAVEAYIAYVQQEIGRMVASLGGLDGLVLTGSIGESSSEIRSLLLPKLAYLGLEISADNNHKTHQPDSPAEIGKTDSASLYVVSAKEDFEMARLAEIIR